uniref:Uncharacterized protein n=1 Tax=Panagrolaimus sp. PS1159 TaxID=55785 RepID=A0AC35FA89_9BILA
MTVNNNPTIQPISPGFEKPCHFFYNVSGERAQELLLEHGKLGDFIVRPSESNKNDHTLSVHRGDRVTHVKIPMKEGQFYLPNGASCPNLRSLVEYICQENVFVERDGTVIEMRAPLIIKLTDRSALIGCDRFFHPMTSGKEVEALLNKEPNGTFLLRESGTTAGEFVIGVKCNDDVLHIKIYYIDGRYKVTMVGEAFRSINELMDNYTRTIMYQANGDPVPLTYPLQCTRFLPCMIEERLDFLKKPSAKNPNKDNAAEEFDMLQTDPESRMFVSCKEGRKPENATKNRYKNIVPFDHTRVKLRTENETIRQSDYINANYIEILQDEKYREFEELPKRYISTQGCLDNTVGAFWRMVWQENSQTIVMITKEVEKGKVKCVKYYPELDEEILTGFLNEIKVKTVKYQEDEEKFIRREFEITKGEEIRKVFHYQFLFWDDYECPADSVQSYMDEVNKCAEDNQIEDCGPMIVHCSAGVGRTGTYICIDILITLIKMRGLNWPIDVTKTVRMLREQRAFMVQTETQYRFIYETIGAFVKYAQMSPRIRNGHSTTLNGPLTPQLGQLKINEDNNQQTALTPSPSSLSASTSPFSNGPILSSSSSSFGSTTTGPGELFTTTAAKPLTEKIILSPPPLPKKNKFPPIPPTPNECSQDYVNSSQNC